MGPPKCVVHFGEVGEHYTAILVIYHTQLLGCALLVQTKKELEAHFEGGMDDTYFQFTTVCLRPRPLE